MAKGVFSKWMWVSTLTIASLAIVASMVGLFNASLYGLETENWRLQAQGQDIGNLIAATALITSAWFAAKGSVRALGIWLGGLIYFLYAYTIYAFALHFNDLFLVYVTILGVTFFTLAAALETNRAAVSVPDKAARKFAAYILVLTGVLFGVMWLSEIAGALLSGETPKSAVQAGLWVNPVHIIDLAVVLPGLVITGHLLFKNNRHGLFFAPPWLTFSILMGSGIVASMVLMTLNDMHEATAPMVLVTVIVAFSLAALLQLLGSLRQAKPKG